MLNDHAPDPWNRFFLAVIVASFAFIGWGLAFGPARWSTSASIEPFRQVLPISVRTAGWLWFAVAALLLTWRTRPAGYGLAVLLVLIFLLQLVQFSLIGSTGPTNIAVVGLMPLAFLAAVAGLRYSITSWRRNMRGRR